MSTFENLSGDHNHKPVDELQERVEAEALARLSENSFAQDWDHDVDAIYDHWKEIDGVS